MARPLRSKRGKILRVLFLIWVAALLFQQLLRYKNDQNEKEELDRKVSAFIISAQKLPLAAYTSWVHGVWIRFQIQSMADNTVVNQVDRYIQLGLSVRVVFIEHNGVMFSGNKQSNEQFESIVNQLHSRGLSVITSMDSFVRFGSAEFDNCKQQFLLLGSTDGKGSGGGKILEWKKHLDDRIQIVNGSLLDLTNVEGVRFYRRRLDKVLSMGVDGLWNDNMDGLFSIAFGHGVKGQSGFVDSDSYANDYYYQTFDYGREKRGFNFITSFLPVDALTRESMWRAFGPIDISFATLVRNHPFSYAGLADAVVALRRSLETGYINVGIEPYGSVTEVENNLVLRWAQLTALCPIMILPLQHLERIRENSSKNFLMLLSEIQRLAQLHDTLKPYYFSLGSLTFFEQFSPRSAVSTTNPEANPFVLRPDATMMSTGNWSGFHIGTNLFFVAVIRPNTLKNEEATQSIPVHFPKRRGPWIPHKAAQLPLTVDAAGSMREISVNSTQMLLFQRAGSAIPVQMPGLPVEILALLVQSPHLSTYPERPFSVDNIAGNKGAHESVIVYSHSGERNVLWYSTETTDKGELWLSINGTSFGTKTVVCVRGLTAAEEIDSYGYVIANLMSDFIENVKSGTSVVHILSEETCLYSSLLTVESNTRFGPLKTI